MGGQRGFLAIIGGIVVLLVATVAVVLLRGDRPAAVFAPGSPEAAVQSYLAAWDAGDDATAHASFSGRIRTATPLDDYRTDAAMLRTKGLGEDASRIVFIDSATTTGDRANVRVTIEVTSVGGMTVNRYRQSATIPMVREDGAWKIDELLMGIEVWAIEKS